MIVADSAAALFFTTLLLAISWRLSAASMLVLPPVALLATFRRKSDLWEVVGAWGLGSGKLHDRTDLSGW
jgi:hypothetical protein